VFWREGTGGKRGYAGSWRQTAKAIVASGVRRGEATLKVGVEPRLGGLLFLLPLLDRYLAPMELDSIWQSSVGRCQGWGGVGTTYQSSSSSSSLHSVFV
jgi:hypothetical protein